MALVLVLAAAALDQTISRSSFVAHDTLVGAEFDANVISVGVYAANGQAVKTVLRGELLGKLRTPGFRRAAHEDVLDARAQFAVFLPLHANVDVTAQRNLAFHAIIRQPCGELAQQVSFYSQNQASRLVLRERGIAEADPAHALH